MELEIPEPLASALQGLVGAHSPLGLQLGGQGGSSGTRVVSCDHIDGHTLTLLCQLGLNAGARDLVVPLLALDNLNGETQRRPCCPRARQCAASTTRRCCSAVSTWPPTRTMAQAARPTACCRSGCRTRAWRFLLLAPQSMFPTWDIVIVGHRPDLQRHERALSTVAAHLRLDATQLAFAGFSDGGSYALSLGLTNSDVASHVIGLSAGFMNTFTQAGAPQVFLAHGRADRQLPIETSAHPHAKRLLDRGYDLTLQPFDGDHVIVPWVVGRAVDFFLGAPEADAR